MITINKYSLILLSISSFSFVQMDCKDEPPVVPPQSPYKQSIFLTVDDSGLTEVYLTLSMIDTLAPRGFEIYRNNMQILTGSLFAKETILVDTTAQLNTNYLYQAYRLENATRKDSSNVVTTKTLDTTSHEFIWTEFTLGDASSNVLRDVHIIDKNNIWCVGEMSINDSTGTSAEPYNAAHWDGIQWNVMQIPVRDFGTLVGIFPLQSVYGFSDSDVWLASYADFIKWDGASSSSKAFFMIDETFNGQVNKIWGTSNSNQYIVGRNGAIYHFTNPSWQKMSSGTTVDLTDVYGTPDGETVWACGYKFDFSASVFLKYTKQTGHWQTIWAKGQFSLYPFSIICSLWGNKKLYVANGAEIYEMSSKGVRLCSPFFEHLVQRIRGTSDNNIVVVTSKSSIWHFNGSTWKEIYSDPKKELVSVAIKGDMIVAVGSDFNTFPEKAVVIVGKR